MEKSSASTRPLVTFITVNYKMARLIYFLLKGLEEAQLPFSFEYLIVDNASGDNLRDMLGDRFPWARIIESSHNRGFSGGNNLGMREAQGEFIGVLNPDLTIFPGQMERWVEWMQAHPAVGISSPRIINPDGSDQDSCYRFPGLFTPVYRRTILGRLPWVKRAMDVYAMKDMDRAREQDVDWVLGAAMLIRRQVLEQIGYMDERFFMYFEDADLCRRAWKSGARVAYTPVATFMHYHARQSRTRHVWQALTNPLARYHIASGLQYFLKYRKEPHPRLPREKNEG